MDVLVDPVLAGLPVAWFSPTYKMLADVWRDVTDLFYPVTKRVSVQEHRLELERGGVIDMWSLEDVNAGRGRKYKTVVIDEAAMVRNLKQAWQAAIRPTLTDLVGAAWFLSTPKGLNEFYSLFRAGQDASQREWRSWQMPTSANPYMPPAEIEAARRDLPERVFSQEFLAEFLADGAYFYNVEAAAVIAVPDEPPRIDEHGKPTGQHAGHTIVMGIDWAKSADYTVLVCVCRECARVVDWERFNQIDFTFQRGRVRNLAHKWAVEAILPERNSIGEPNIEMLRADDLPIAVGADQKHGFFTSASSKALIIEKLALAIGSGQLKVPAEFAGELRAFEISTRPIGAPHFSAPEGGHDDEVMALALAWHLASIGIQLWI